MPCTLCRVGVRNNLIEHWNDATLCPHCFKVHQDAGKIEEETTQPWTIDESLGVTDWQVELLRRRRAYYDGLSAQ